MIEKDGIIAKDCGTCELIDNFWLATCGAEYGIYDTKKNDGAEQKSDSELKGLASTLGEDYGHDEEINEGYPYLKYLKY